eukprot:CAMPEP_0181121186 /NCGR_PEP_ID=MMETSP1071-20121207/24593_1 /TAXON_ID=35127 /ORGANISM="Thalassiosira sp., Strain NH16" /LENGTH=123 /DNA_ID=CAMNT_0023205967 /DNA_START=77 /DNA_END=445 /DNA_ORIENTATION=-
MRSTTALPALLVAAFSLAIVVRGDSESTTENPLTTLRSGATVYSHPASSGILTIVDGSRRQPASAFESSAALFQPRPQSQQAQSQSLFPFQSGSDYEDGSHDPNNDPNNDLNYSKYDSGEYFE